VKDNMGVRPRRQTPRVDKFNVRNRLLDVAVQSEDRLGAKNDLARFHYERAADANAAGPVDADDRRDYTLLIQGRLGQIDAQFAQSFGVYSRTLAQATGPPPEARYCSVTPAARKAS
jgi:hypothetical protein